MSEQKRSPLAKAVLDAEQAAVAAWNAVPSWYRDSRRPQPRGATRLQFSHASAR